VSRGQSAQPNQREESVRQAVNTPLERHKVAAVPQSDKQIVCTVPIVVPQRLLWARSYQTKTTQYRDLFLTIDRTLYAPGALTTFNFWPLW
jgi:hypothetical protein